MGCHCLLWCILDDYDSCAWLIPNSQNINPSVHLLKAYSTTPLVYKFVLVPLLDDNREPPFHNTLLVKTILGVILYTSQQQSILCQTKTISNFLFCQ